MGYGGIKWNIIEYMQHVVNNNQQYDIWVRLKMGNSLLAKSFDWQMPISIFAFHWGNQADGFGTTHLFQDWE